MKRIAWSEWRTQHFQEALYIGPTEIRRCLPNDLESSRIESSGIFCQ